MLGKKQNASLFSETRHAAEAPKELPRLCEVPPDEPGKEAVFVSESEPARALLKPGAGRAHSLFFTPEDSGQSFGDVLKGAQTFVADNYPSLVTPGDPAAKAQLKRYIAKYIQDCRAAVPGMSAEELTDALYSDMAEFSFLTKYITAKDVEEINIFAYNNIVVLYNDGRSVRLKEHFASPEQAFNVVRRMLHISGVILDNSTPVAEGYLARNIRIAAMKEGVVDADVGVCASIRIVNPLKLQKDDFIRSGTATEQMLDFLALCVRYGISVCVAGSTGSGKTTLLDWLLGTAPDWMRVFTIETDARELYLVKHDGDGNPVNCVIHTNTKGSVTSDDLLHMALRFHPNIICPSEMRGVEAHTAVEAANTGHTVATTTHSSNARDTWDRIFQLAQRKYGAGDTNLMDHVYRAFPIVVYAKQLENMQRKITAIMECERWTNGEPRFHKLFEYNITENRFEDDRFYISGEHRQCGQISESLRDRFIQNGMPTAILNKLTAKEATGA